MRRKVLNYLQLEVHIVFIYLFTRRETISTFDVRDSGVVGPVDSVSVLVNPVVATLFIVQMQAIEAASNT